MSVGERGTSMRLLRERMRSFQRLNMNNKPGNDDF